MRRWSVGVIVGVVLMAATASGQGITGALRIQDGASSQMLRITHYGGLLVTIYNDPGFGGIDQSTTISHITGIVHVSGIIRGFGPLGTNVVDVANLALNVNCVVGCAASTPGPIPHITSVTHVAGGVSLLSRAGVYVGVSGTSLDVNCTGGCTGGSSDTVNVFHQSTVAHVSSVTHVAGLISLGARDGTYATLTGTALNVNLTNTPAVTQSGEWNVRHVTSVTHVAVVTGPAMTTLRVYNAFGCGSTARTVLAANPNRKKLILKNLGTLPIWVLGGHATLTSGNTSTGVILHANTTAANTTETSTIDLSGYTGPIDCIATSAGVQSQQLSIIELQ